MNGDEGRKVKKSSLEDICGEKFSEATKAVEIELASKSRKVKKILDALCRETKLAKKP